MESRYWGVMNSCSKPVTIAKEGQIFYFKSFGDCAKFLADFEGLSFYSLKLSLTRRAEYIAGWKVFYERENVE